MGGASIVTLYRNDALQCTDSKMKSFYTLRRASISEAGFLVQYFQSQHYTALVIHSVCMVVSNKDPFLVEKNLALLAPSIRKKNDILKSATMIGC